MVAAPRPGRDASTVTPIDELIRRHRDRTGASFMDMQRASGDKVLRQRWQQLAKGDGIKEFPEPDTIRAIAATLLADETDVVLGFASAVGLDVRSSGPAVPLPAGAEQLDDAQRKVLWETARVFLSYAEVDADKVVELTGRRVEDPRLERILQQVPARRRRGPKPPTVAEVQDRDAEEPKE